MRLKLVMMSALTMLTVFSSDVADEVKNAARRMPEIMEKPSLFFEIVKDMSFTNKVLFIEMTDKAAKTYPGMDDDSRSNLIATLEKYYYISTNTPYLNVPLVIVPKQIGLALRSEMQYLVNGTNAFYVQKTDRTNLTYKVNSNCLDFSRDMDSDVILIFDDHISIPAKFKDGRRGDPRLRRSEPTPYSSQMF